MVSKSNQEAKVNKDAYPFVNHYISLEAGQMHYVDEGSGDVILFVHGTPTWSFLYRRFISYFSKTHRCIAIDHLGFGLSEKSTSYEGTPQWHSKNLIEFITRLDITNVTLVVHDFGGPIGLSAGIQESSRIKQVVLFNSWLWETKQNEGALKIDRVLNSWLGRMLYLTFNFSARVLMKKGFYDKSKLSKKTHRQYLLPFPSKASRQVLLDLGKSLVGSSDWYQEQWKNLESINGKPWLILWGSRDEFITEDYLSKWVDRIPQAEVHLYKCGHFVQEEAAEESIKKMDQFLKKQ